MKPNVLVIAGHDPSGGAGIHADIEALHALGCLPSTLITGLTVQNSINVSGFRLTDVDLLRQQADALLDDFQYSAVKIGMTGSPAIIDWIASVLDRLPGVPVVLDPVLAAEAGGSLGEASVPDALMQQLFPKAALVTPNLDEARALTGCETIAEAGNALLDAGCLSALITGTHDNTTDVRNHLFLRSGHQDWAWPRLDGSFHGSGCTLASACAATLAHGGSLVQAVENAQAYVAATLRGAWQAGRGQLIPDRSARP